MLFWLGVFSILYGLRLWLHLSTAILLMPEWMLYPSFGIGVSYLVPIPGSCDLEGSGVVEDAER